jgi:FkbM family methyltransferase
MTQEGTCLEVAHGENVGRTRPEVRHGGVIWEMSTKKPHGSRPQEEHDMFKRIKDLMQQRIDSYRYKRLKARVEKPRFPPQQLKAEGYYSQFGQDKWVIENLFPGKKKGIFVDIGANDGITFSNTYLLETMGWHGLAVEPVRSVYDKLVKNRRCITVNGCVAPGSGKKLFRVITGYPQMLSGLVDEYDPRHLERIERELDSRGGEYTDVEVNCYNFNELLEANGICCVDYLSIDVEGAEYKILDSIDFSRVYIAVIGVENNFSDLGIPRLLMKRGFDFRAFVGGDDFYLNRKAPTNHSG